MTDSAPQDGGNGRLRNQYCSGCPIPGEVADLRNQGMNLLRMVTGALIEIRENDRRMTEMLGSIGHELAHVSKSVQDLNEKQDCHAQAIDCQSKVVGQILRRLDKPINEPKKIRRK